MKLKITTILITLILVSVSVVTSFGDDIERIIYSRKNYKRNTIPTAKKIPCAPRDTIEEIKATAFVTYDPTCIAVKRCGGCCDNIRKCSATATQKKQVRVKKTDLTGQTGHHIVNYEDHTACSCQCKKQASDCSSTQTFNSDTCKCDCKTTQTCQAGKKWSTIACKCVCNHIKNCSTGQIWNSKTCQCNAVVYPKCSNGLLNLKTCTCN